MMGEFKVNCQLVPVMSMLMNVDNNMICKDDDQSQAFWFWREKNTNKAVLVNASRIDNIYCGKLDIHLV
jgi:hypothetical protein